MYIEREFLKELNNLLFKWDAYFEVNRQEDLEVLISIEDKDIQKTLVINLGGHYDPLSIFRK